MSQVRCAIYTRKSSEEGLEQDFNSLHAQREACAAYILSQASEGWSLVLEDYDDGGLSGGSLERPALQRLIADVAAGRLDIIVVYKVDRLTRSLLDFAKLVEAFDRAGVSFVSVTQSFNTTTSMGRLTLNMLLSFAQFEREVTAERIRDKIAASKARGMWMGGTPPLGYAPHGRSLAVVDEHAALVRMIYECYRQLGAVRQLSDELQARGVLTPVRTTRSGKTFGGCPFSRGQLYAILRNRIYVGDISHRGKVHPGNHPPIINRDEWDAVQTQLNTNIQGTRLRREANSSMLAGRVRDENGEPLIAVHSCKGARRYRYYVSKECYHRIRGKSERHIRIPATDLEKVVCSELSAVLGAPVCLMARCQIDVPPSLFATMVATCQELARQAANRDRTLIRKAVELITVRPANVEITVSTPGIADLLGVGLAADSTGKFVHEVSMRLSRTGRSLRLVDDGGAAVAQRDPDETLGRLVARARTWWDEIERTGVTVSELASKEGVTASYLTRVIRLAFLSPDVVTAIVSGSLRAGVDASQLFAAGAIHWAWSEQRSMLLPAAS